MILRDPVHGLVSFEGDAEHVVTSLLATPEVQRMRSVRQLGLTSLVFPGAEHSRFAHALGTTHVMTQLLARIRAADEQPDAAMRLDASSERDAVAAALLHDVGHGPFSHLFEEVLPGALPHEAWSQRILLDPDTGVHRTLEGIERGMAARVSGLVRGKHRLGYLGRAISGLLDVDRADYLLRDSHMTGVRYGLYDLEWLLRALAFAQIPGGEWVLAIEGRKGLPPIEGFFLGRHFMYRQVYHHKATRAAECLIRAIFVRMAEIEREGGSLDPMPSALRAAARGLEVTLGAYLELDDVQLLYCIQSWSKGNDAVLADLCARLLERRLPKTVPVPTGSAAAPKRAALRDALEGVARKRGLRPDLSVWFDVTSDAPYPEPDDGGAEGVWVALRHHSVQRLGSVSFLLGELRNKMFESARVVFMPELREDALACVNALA